ncbi:zinc finger protein RFP-like [Anolis sagrei]|uniref:zinc finger protein RFP-like n=1 Tax=Anolis sagrei TaxID=38937 RepID=UPI0035210FCF
MASGGLVKKLCEELACSICLEYFKEPVTISCGHNFCRACLDQGKEEEEFPCPQCRQKVQKRGLKRNWKLANLVEIATEMEKEKGRLCQRHQEPLKLFCKDHDAPICMVCDRSKEHENHQVIPLDEASKEYKDQIGNYLETLKKEREKILAYKADTARESKYLLEKTQREKEKTVAAFRFMHQFLEEQKRNLLAKMEEVEKEISAKEEEHLARLPEELSTLSKLIQEMEEKHQQPASELLQDIRSTLEGYKNKETFETSAAFPPALKWKIWDFRDFTPFLQGVMKQFRASLESGLQQEKAYVTLDPDTAHPWLTLSEDRRHVTRGEKRQDLPHNPERFNHYPFVLGQEGFTGGRHFWEALVKNEEEWFVGVARKSVQRKGAIPCSPGTGIWTVGKAGGRDVPPSLTRSEEPKTVRVTLNYEGGRVAFYDADSAAPILEYPPASFSGETLLPFFYVNKKTHLELSP